MKIIFMGTPDFALFSLRALVEDSGEEVVAVVTQPDKAKGRGYQLAPPPVKVYAEAHGIPVLQPATLRDDAAFDALRSFAPDLIVVTAYGKILPARILELPPLGCVNVHGSLLPAYRGAAPMQRAIMDGQTETGVTTMMMDVGMDTGDMLLRAKVPILPDDNFETIHDKLGVCGAKVLLDTLAAIRQGTLVRHPQDNDKATYAAKIEKSDCLIDFSLPAPAVHDRIRGLSPIPLAFTHTPDGKLLKVIASRVAEPAAKLASPGTVLSLSDGAVTVACAAGSVQLLELLPEGKSRMSAAAFINGRKLKVGDVLG